MIELTNRRRQREGVLGPAANRVLFIENIPNVLLQFGLSSRFRVYIFFLNLRPYTKLYKISPESNAFFVDYILIPAVKMLTGEGSLSLLQLQAYHLIKS